MAYSDTVLRQILALVPRYEFDTLAVNPYSSQKFRTFNCWSQFLPMLVGQFAVEKASEISLTITAVS